MTDTPSLTLVVLTYQEGIHLARCLESAAGLADHIIIVDSFSTDRTVEIAKAFGAQVVQRRFVNQAEQLQWALDTLEFTSKWVLRLDADEVLSAGLRDELIAALPKVPDHVTGLRLKRRVIFQDQWIRWGGYHHTVLLRCFRTGAARVEQMQMDEHIVLRHGQTQTLTHTFADHNLRDITWWTAKHNAYATRKMVDYLSVRNVERGRPSTGRPVQDTLQYGLYRRAPRYLRVVLLFVYRYFLRLGFLDGRAGFLWCFLQAGWYPMLVDAKIGEALRIERKTGRDGLQRWLLEHHGIELHTDG